MTKLKTTIRYWMDYTIILGLFWVLVPVFRLSPKFRAWIDSQDKHSS